MAMNYARFKSVLANMTTAAQKVYAAIPALGAWSYDEIAAEVRRLGCHMDYRTMQGCIRALVDANLVREIPGNGKGTHFVRTEVRGKPPKPLKAQEQEAVEQPKEVPMAQPISSAPSKNPVDILGELAAKARTLSQHLNSLAVEIDAAALAAQDYVENSDADTAKLRQLQTLLKSLA